ncbi:hypothetical protein Tco_0663446 [Tanacetum coccineum]
MNKKSYSFDMETFRNMLLICPKIPRRKFVDPPFEEEILTFIRELGSRQHEYLLSNAMLIRYLNLENFWSHHQTSVFVVQPKTEYVCRSSRTKTDEAPKPSSDIALTEAEQMKLAIERSKTQIHLSQPSGSGTHEGTGVTPGVPDVPTYKSDDEQVSLDCQLPGPEEPEQAPPSPIYVPFVPEPVYPEFLPEDDVLPVDEEQPLCFRINVFLT